jgi:large subunit ribosomal protein L24
MLSHIRTGDFVAVVAGKDKGKRGKVLRILGDKGRVVVEHCAMMKRHSKPSQKQPQGGILEKEGSIDLSNVRLVCPKCDKPRRFKVAEREGHKVRNCVKCDTEVQASAAG